MKRLLLIAALGLSTLSLQLSTARAASAMSQPKPYTPARLLTELRGDLEPWVKARKGELSVARDPYHFLELLAESPAGWRAVLHWDGETQPSDDAQAGVFAVQKISVGVTANLGLTAKPDESLHKKSATRPALTELVAAVRERVRSHVWPDITTQGAILYRGCDAIVLPDSAIPLAGFRLNFELTIALPDVDYRNA